MKQKLYCVLSSVKQIELDVEKKKIIVINTKLIDL